MKIKIKKSDLKEKFKFLKSICDKKNVHEILSYILFEAETDNVILTATNLSAAIITEIKTDIIEKGNIAISNVILDKVLKLKSNSDLIITDKEIKVDDNVFNFTGFTKDDFPIIKDIEETEKSIKFELGSRLLNKVLTECGSCMHTDIDTKPFLRGIYFECENSNINFVGTDGFRLYLINETIDKNNFKFILKKDDVSLLKKLNLKDCMVEFIIFNNEIRNIQINVLDKKEVKQNDSLDYFFDDNKKTKNKEKSNVLFKMITFEVQETFPKYAQVIPKEYNHIILLDTNKLIEFLGCVIIKDECYRINFKFSGQKLTLKYSDLMEKTIDIENNNPADLEFDLSYTYLTNYFNMKKQFQKIEMKLVDNKSPIVMTEKGNCKDFIIIMPMRE